VKISVRKFLLAAAVVVTAGCGSSASVEQPPKKGSAELPSVNVSVVELKPTELTERVVLAGRVEPWVEVQVATELGGTVEEVGFEKGQVVRKGRVLARVGSDLRAAQLQGAEAQLLAAEAHYEKTSKLLERQAVPRQELIAATSRYGMAQASKLEAEILLERSVIKAPITGVALDRHIEPGEVLPPGAPITTLHQLNRLKVVVGIPENDISFFEVGGEATIGIDAYPGRDFEGRLHYLSPAASGKNRTFPAEIEIANAEKELRPGMMGRVSLVKERYPDALVVPRDALLERDEGSVAFVLEEDRARVKAVVLGPSEADHVVVKEGLAAGDWLIVTGQRGLVDGQPVKVVGKN
jgi:membrane fusion protein (multidrug efflux system)